MNNFIKKPVRAAVFEERQLCQSLDEAFAVCVLSLVLSLKCSPEDKISGNTLLKLSLLLHD